MTARSRISAISLALPVLLAAVSCKSSEKTEERTEARTEAKTGTPPDDPARAPVETTAAALPAERRAGAVDVIARFDGAMPTGVTVSRSGRIFVSFPRWGDVLEQSVAEVKDGRALAYPSPEVNGFPGGDPAKTFVAVQSVVIDPDDHLWVVDTGNPELKGVVPRAPKLVRIDLATNEVVKTIPIPPEVALPTTYMNDVRFDLTRGAAGMAFVTDSAKDGAPNAIIVVDLATGKSWRRLADHPSTKPEKGFMPFVEGRELYSREPGKARAPVQIGADGIAVSRDGARLFYCPLSSRRLYGVSIDALVDPKKSDAEVAKTVVDMGEKGASDGLESDAEGRIYLTSYEHNAVLRRSDDGAFETLLHDPRALWPDTLSLADDGSLYVIANQLHRQPQYNGGKDERVKPYLLLRVKTDGRPVRLTRTAR